MASADEILVTLPQGILRGKKETSCYDDIYYGFHGIPYAKPPLGDLRFKAPQPAEGWAGIRDATKRRAAAPRVDFATGEYDKELSDEDCLFINVYTKEVPDPEKKYPVLVWIHGGGFTNGSGNKDEYSPDYFMVHDIVFVAMNYRLGALGFLSLQTTECPGNNGLKDIRLALRWVQENISYFGGNPENVTIFGESAGAAAVHYSLLSPSCKGLFKRAIAQSGSAYNTWSYARHPRESAYLLGKRLGCNATNDEELLNFLRNAPVDDIITKSERIILEIEEEHIGENILNFSFVPTNEPESEEAFITRPPLLGGYQLDVPLISGVTDKEMLMIMYSPKQVPEWKEDKDFQKLIPKCLNVEKDTELSLKIAKKIKEFYFKDGINVDDLTDAMSDSYIVHGVHQEKIQRITNPNIKSPTYLYVFSYEGKSSPMKTLMSMALGIPNEKKGVPHAEDLGYLFIAEFLGSSSLEKESAEYEVMRRMVDIWVNFAATGMPMSEKSEIDWKPTKVSEDVYLDIGQELQLKNGFFKERMQYWDDVFKLAGFKI